MKPSAGVGLLGLTLKPIKHVRGVSSLVELHGWRGIGAWQEGRASEIRLGFMTLLLVSFLVSVKWHAAILGMQVATDVLRSRRKSDEPPETP